MPISESNSKVTVEQLLRLKRAERPSPEFWVNFERELHQKQLTALVKKRRWWHEMPSLLSRKVYLPAGAAAVMAFTFISVRQSTPLTSVQGDKAAPSAVAIAPTIETLAPIIVASSTAVAQEAAHLQAAQPAVHHAAVRAQEANLGAPQPILVAAEEISSPSARSIAANLARLEQTEPELINSVMGNRLSSTARVQMVSASQDVIDSADSFESPRKYRLIARYADRALSPEPSAPAGVRERIARRLGDDLGDGISRIGIVGSRVSLKF